MWNPYHGGTIHQLTKKLRINLWSALSWAKDDPKKGRRLSLQANGQLLPSNRLWLCGAQKKKLAKTSGTYPKLADTKIAQKKL